MPDLIRRDPMLVAGPFRQAMERFFDDPLFRTPMNFFSEEGSAGLPLDISENEREIVVKADLPGYSKDEIDVQMHEGVLSIRAQHATEYEDKGDRYYRRERSWGAVSRRVALPGVVEDAPVQATLKDGVLTLKIARPEKPGPKQIRIDAETDAGSTPQVNGANGTPTAE